MIQGLETALHIDGWQPIESAPKDGTPVLLYEQGLIGLFYWGIDPKVSRSATGDPLPEEWIGAIIQSELNASDVKDKLIRIVGSDASHWMPLPLRPDDLA